MGEAAGVVWIVSDGIPGEYNQSLAVAEALAARGYGPIRWVKARRLRGILRPFPGWLLGLTRAPLPRRIERALVEGELPRQAPAIVVSSGGKTANANAAFARRHAAANVFIGKPPHMSARHFSAILHAEEDWSPGNGIRMDLLPTRLSAAEARAKAAEFRAELGLGERRLCAMLIGGNSRGHTFRPDEWKTLAEGMNRLAAANGFAWVVTTSRRTGAEAETTIRAVLDPALVADATWWGSQPRPVMVPYLGVAEVVFCTHDSRAMLSEGLASGKPVYALLPDRSPEGDGYHMAFVAQHEAGRRLRRVPIAEMGAIDLAGDVAGYFKVLTTDVMADMTDRLLALMRLQVAVTAQPAA